LKPSTRATLRFAIVLLLWHAGFYALTLHFGVLYMGDSWEYITGGYNLLEHSWLYSGSPSMPVVEEYMTQRTPLYPAFLAGVYALGGDNWTAIFLQGLVSIASLLLLRSTMLRLGHNPPGDWLLLLLLLTFPPQYIHAMWVEPEMLLQLFTVLYFRSWVILVQKKKPSHAWAMSAWLIIGLFTKPVMFPFVAVHAALLIAACFRWRLSKAVLLAALLPVVAVLTYRHINKLRTGHAHFSSNQAFNALYYAYPYIAHRHGNANAMAWLQTQRAAVEKLPLFADRYNEAERHGRTFLKNEWHGYLPFHLRGSARLLIDPGKADLDLFTGRLTYGKLYGIAHPGATRSPPEVPAHGSWRERLAQPSFILALLIALFNLVRLTGVALFLADKRQWVMVRLFLLFLVLYFSGLAGPIAVPRYLLPVWPLIAGAAALGWSRILARRNSSSVAYAPAA
jgi:hypothetical protein